MTILACVSSLWGTCMFISSPSKSALYGGVAERFNRNDQFNKMTHFMQRGCAKHELNLW